jgi:hypothetical protein
MWPLKWVFVAFMLFFAWAQFGLRNSPSVDEWAVVPLMTALTFIVLLRDAALLVLRRDEEPRARGLRIASCSLLAVVVAINVWITANAPWPEDDPLPDELETGVAAISVFHGLGPSCQRHVVASQVPEPLPPSTGSRNSCAALVTASSVGQGSWSARAMAA